MRDLAGANFGRLTVTSFNRVHVTPNGTKKYRWNWTCRCGAVGSSSAGDLRSGRTRSCGCLQRETVAVLTAVDLVGERFGRLLVVERSIEQHPEWVCRCDCGNETVVNTNRLRSGNTSSCGCFRVGVTSFKYRELVTYSSAHFRMRRKHGSAREHSCVDCGGVAKDWSYIGGDPNELTESDRGTLLTYSLDMAFYSPRCKSCHKVYDLGRRSA